MPMGIAESPDVTQARTMPTQRADDGGKVGYVRPWDVGCGRKMLQAERLDGPRRVIRQDIADPSLLGTREHGGGYRSRMSAAGPAGRACEIPGTCQDGPA